MAADWLGLRVAELGLWLDAHGSGIQLAMPPCHAQFLVDEARGDGLLLRVRDGALPDTKGWQPIFRGQQTWQLWYDGAGRHVFVAPSGSPPRRQITVDAAFTAGEVVGEFTEGAAGDAVYPLQDIDMVVFSNWLARTGDLIVHASGVDDDGQGYAFVGPSGSGKSTLVSELASRPKEAAEADTTRGRWPVVLGEDNLILRCLGGRFWVYGTPWHTDPTRCSPGGVPLTKLFFLDRAGGHHVEPCGARHGIERLLQDAIIPYYNRAGVERILDTLLRLTEQVPFYYLGFQIGADALKLIREV